MQTKCAIASAVFLLSLSCRTAPPAARAIDPARLVDLTYTYDESTIYWPNAEGFRHRKDAWTRVPEGYWYAAGEFTTAEHGGTHMDSPIHFGEAKWTLDQIPVANFVAPACVIDVAAKAAADRDYRATPEDIAAWETEHGTIPPGSVVVFRTGWGSRWPNRKEYLGSDAPGDVKNLHFPGISREAAELLVERRVHGVGIDTASIDHGPSTDFIAHQTLHRANIYCIENIANAERLPATGATIIALPIKIGEGSGGPARVVALLP